MMAQVKHSLDQETLRHNWQKRCAESSFSPTVLGVGTVRIFGKSGDAPITFPRIESLAALDTLQPDERWAVEIAQQAVTEARSRNRPVMATQPPQAGATPTPTPLRSFDPSQQDTLILSLTRGG